MSKETIQSQLLEAENELKTSFNNYIDSMAIYLSKVEEAEKEGIKPTVEPSTYLLDNHISMGLNRSLDLVNARSSKEILSKKIS